MLQHIMRVFQNKASRDLLLDILKVGSFTAGSGIGAMTLMHRLDRNKKETSAADYQLYTEPLSDADNEMLNRIIKAGVDTNQAFLILKNLPAGKACKLAELSLAGKASECYSQGYGERAYNYGAFYYAFRLHCDAYGFEKTAKTYCEKKLGDRIVAEILQDLKKARPKVEDKSEIDALLNGTKGEVVMAYAKAAYPGEFS